MALSMKFITVFSVLAFSPLCFANTLSPYFYDHSCPKAQEIVRSVVAKAVAKEARMAASLLRLHFHDCFVQGCDGSLLLDSRGSIVSEKGSNPNRNSARGFEVVDEIKAELEKDCPQTVSCADALALAARDSTVLAGGPSWVVPLGRRDSRGASLSGSNNNIPAPNNTLPTIITKFKRQDLGVVDLVALSGSHTIGLSRCTSFRQRLYNQSGNGKPDSTLDQAYASQLRSRCPRSGGDQNLFPLDFVSPTKFDNSYFKNIVASKGLLSSDQVLFTRGQQTMELVKLYAENNELFLKQFATSMIKMGNITPLTGKRGEIRKNCRRRGGGNLLVVRLGLIVMGAPVIIQARGGVILWDANGMNVQFVHQFREGNQAADFLAKLGESDSSRTYENLQDLPRLLQGTKGVVYLAIFLIALGNGGLQPSIATFGADQFDEVDPQGGHSIVALFSYFFLALYLGSPYSISILGYFEDTGMWPLGFWVSSASAVVALLLFLCGTPRYSHFRPGGNPLPRVLQVRKMADAVVSIFLEKLVTSLMDEHHIISEVQEQFQKMKRQLELMQSFLKDADRIKRKNQALYTVMKDLRELIYDADDILADCQTRLDEEGGNTRGCFYCFSPADVPFLSQTGR
ncbi:hypothetical protein ACLOJK_001865 [Asimina triloba]